MTVAGTGLSSLIREKKRGCKKNCPLSKEHYQYHLQAPEMFRIINRWPAWLSDNDIGRLTGWSVRNRFSVIVNELNESRAPISSLIIVEDKLLCSDNGMFLIVKISQPVTT